MKILHLSRTPCAGAIHALSSAINDYTEHESRWIGRAEVGTLSFPKPDCAWTSTGIYKLLAEAEALVLHNYLGPDEQPVKDFLAAHPEKIVAAYYHSHPAHCAVHVRERGYGSFCMAQFQAILHEGSVPIRNVIRFDRADWPPRPVIPNGYFRIGYAPTTQAAQTEPKPAPGWYDSKGYEKTIEVLEEVEEALNDRVELVVIEGVRYDMALRLKAGCHLFIDEVVTGSFHRNALESLAMGIPTVCGLDPEIAGVVAAVTGADSLPFLVSGPENLKDDLIAFVERPEADRLSLGEKGRNWMERHWHPRDIASGFVEELARMPCHGEVVSRKADE